MKDRLLFVLVVFMGVAQSNGQMVGPCPPITARDAQNVKELRGVVVDQNLAVVPRVKVSLQSFDGRISHEIELAETDQAGRFSFRTHPAVRYRLIFTGPLGLCPATIPIRYSKTGFMGIRLTLPTAATDTCPQYCESRLKVEEMTGLEGKITDH